MKRKVVRVQVDNHSRLLWTLDKRFSWDMEWKGMLGETFSMHDLIAYFEQTDTSLFKIFLKHLPKRGRILEAGCGFGHWVIILGQHGYDIEGVDTSPTSIRTCKKVFPKARVRHGDVGALKFHNKSLAAYVSIGVVEHTLKGPHKLLREAYRVLEHDGKLLCSVPWMSPYRRMTVKKARMPKKVKNFYQWGFSTKEFREILEEMGFEVKAAIPYAILLPRFVTNLISLFKKRSAEPKKQKKKKPKVYVKSSSSLIKRFGMRVLNLYPIRAMFGHMIMFVAVKK